MVAEPPKAAEPTNAAEAAAKKAAENAATDVAYQALVAKLPPDQQAWERTLQENLGSFYLPIHKREKVRGTSNAWDFVADDPKLPRALLIGDSVSIGYTLPTRALLKDKANVHRIPVNGGATEVGISHMAKWLGTGKWDVIHFNWGLHDLKSLGWIGSLVFDNAVVSYNGDAVIHFSHPTWRTDRNNPATATRIDGAKVS